MIGPSSLLSSFQISAQRDCLADGYLSQGGSAADEAEAVMVKLMIRAERFHQD